MSASNREAGERSIVARGRTASRALFRSGSPSDRTAAAKERIYATLTGLAVTTAGALDAHSSTPEMMRLLVMSVLGITGAGLVAEVIAHQVSHGSYPAGKQLARMLRIALGAAGSAVLPLLALATAAVGLLPDFVALLIAIGLYFLSLTVIVLIAARRTRLSWRQQVASIAVLAAAGAIAVMVLVLAH